MNRTFLYILLAALAAPFSFVFAQTSGDASPPEDFRYYRMNSGEETAIARLGSTTIPVLAIPVLIGVELHNLTRNFGDPRGGGTRTHEGLDILAPKGTPIASPTDAVVLQSGDGPSSGLYVRTANPGGETFVYMHLSEIAKNIPSGTVLKAGDIVGFVGNTGNASGGVNHLHFEIRKNGATDPFPRLLKTFTLAERIVGFGQALERISDPNLPLVWVTNFRGFFDEVLRTGLIVPPPILSIMMATPPVVTPPTAPYTPPSSGFLALGASGFEVIKLQQFLILNARGAAGDRLRQAGATGNFGPITAAALIEYQVLVGLSPTGVLDTATQGAILATPAPVQPVPPIVPAPIPATSFYRDLKLGEVGEDVRALQVFLNTHGFLVAQIGTGSRGFESPYFGPRTQSTLARYQSSVGISPAVGYFGPITRAWVTTH